jgi:hypothetical protein
MCKCDIAGNFFSKVFVIMFPVCVQWCARHAAAVAGGAVASLAVAGSAVAGGAVASLAVAGGAVASTIATVPHLL